MSNSLLSVVYSICIILCFSAPVPLEEVTELLRPHHTTMLEYLLVFLQKKDVKFQQLCIVTISNLKKGLYFVHLICVVAQIIWSSKIDLELLGCSVLSSSADGDFSSLLANSELEVQLRKVHAQTEETRRLLQMIQPLSPSFVNP